MNSESPSGVDDTEANSEGDLNDDSSNIVGVNKDILKLIAFMGSVFIGGFLGLVFLFQGNLILAGIFMLVGSVLPVLLATNAGSLREQVYENSKSQRQNKPSSSTKECPNCGWHNHQANNNCVDCGDTFPDRTDHQQPYNSKHICQHCGWQNPNNNNYCMDCGEVLNE